MIEVHRPTISANSDWAVVTVVTRNYLHFVRALAISLRSVHPEATIVVFILDSDGLALDCQLDQFEVLTFDSLNLPHGRRFLFQYTPFEALAAIRSYLLVHIFKTTGLNKLLYFDADIQIYSGLDSLLEVLQEYNLILTPHLARPRSVDGIDHWEKDVLDTGVFNIGFLGVRRSEQSLSMLRWWWGRVEKLCIFANHYEQGWLNAVPTLFDDVLIERGPQYNAAVWNTGTRDFSEDAQGQVNVNGRPLVFFHFASVDPDKPDSLSRVARRSYDEEPVAVRRLHRDYLARLKACGMVQCRAWGYQYDRLEDGTKIKEEWRELIRTDHPALQNVENPFSVTASEFQRVARQEKMRKLQARAGRAYGRLFNNS
jgi:hypothetical protein